MEQNKTLLIVGSIALFLTLLLGIGLWLFYPRGKVTESTITSTSKTAPAFDPIEWVRTKEEFPQLQPKGEEKKEDVVILYGEKPVLPQETPAKTVPPAASPRPEPVKPAPPAPTPSREVVKPAPKITPAPAPTKTPPKTITVKEYTIQVGSFSSLDKAEEAGRLLKEKGLTGQIVVREVDGNRFYRLRIGPYENKAEAEKFLDWVKTLRGFENSIIFERMATKTVAN